MEINKEYIEVQMLKNIELLKEANINLITYLQATEDSTMLKIHETDKNKDTVILSPIYYTYKQDIEKHLETIYELQNKIFAYKVLSLRNNYKNVQADFIRDVFLNIEVDENNEDVINLKKDLESVLKEVLNAKA